MSRLVLLAAFQVPPSVLVALIVLVNSNTLSSHGQWISTKTTLARNVMGAQSFVEDRVATSENQLDLGAWHGYQEVILAHALPASTRRVSFDMTLAEDAYLSFIFNETSSGFAGIRLSGNSRFPAALFVADRDGRFSSKEEFALEPALQPGQRYRVTVAFGGERVRLFLDGRLVRSFALSFAPGSRIGFRGSQRSAVIDDIEISDGSKNVFREEFVSTTSVLPLSLLAFGVLALVSWAIGRLARRRRPGRVFDNRALFPILTFHLVLTVTLAAVLFSTYTFAGRRYPIAAGLEAEERAWALDEAEGITEQIRQSYTPRPRPDTYRILVVGSSQTWGAGASREEDTFVRQIERKLNDRLPAGKRVECINTGVSGLDSNVLIRQYYLDEWIGLAPHLVLVNLSNNDQRDTPDFPENLEALVRANRERDVETLFVLEAQSLENPEHTIRRNHRRMRAVAEKHGVPVVDMHRRIVESHDLGFFWWDHIHLTSFGHTFVADELTETIWNGWLEGWAQAPERQ